MNFGMPGVKELSMVFFRPFCRAGGPAALGMNAFLATGRLRIRRRRLGGRAVGGNGAWLVIFWVSHGDEADAAAAQFFVNSSLAPVLLFRRRFQSVADALKGIRQHGFSPGRLEALHRYWGAVCRHGLVWTCSHFGAVGLFASPRPSRFLQVGFGYPRAAYRLR